MNGILTKTFLFIVLSLAWGCSEVTDPHVHKASEGIFSGDPIWKIQHLENVGDQYVYHFAISEKISGADPDGKPFGYDLSMDNWLDWEWVTDSLMEHPAKLTFRRVRYQTQQSDTGKVTVIDTDKDPGASQLDFAFRSMIGKSFFVDFDAYGVVRKTRGLQNIMADIYPDTLYGPNDQFTESLNLDALFPSKLVRAGDSWSSVFGRKAHYPFYQDAVYELRAVDGYIANIAVSGELRPHANTLRVIEAGIPVSYDLSGNKTGEYFVRLDKGFVQSSRTVYSLRGTKETFPTDSTHQEYSIKILRVESSDKTRIIPYDSTRFPVPMEVVPPPVDTVKHPIDSLADRIRPVHFYPENFLGRKAEDTLGHYFPGQ